MSKRQQVYDYMLNELRLGNFCDDVLGVDFLALANIARWMFGEDYADISVFLEWAHDIGDDFVCNSETDMSE